MSTVKDPLDPISRTPPDGGTPEPFADGEASHSPLLILFGLLVVWGSLYLVAIAQNISYKQPAQAAAAGSPAPPAASAPFASETTPESLPVSSMLMPVENLSLREIPARQVVKDLLYKAHLHIDPKELDKIGAEVRDVHFEDKPLYACLYSTLGEDTLGLVVVEDQVRLIPQQVTDKAPDRGPLEQFHWDADLILSGRPASLFPTGRSDLWVRLRLLPPSGAGNGELRVAFEVFRGTVREGSGEAILPEPGSGSLRFVAGSRLSLRIENRGEVGASEQDALDEIPIGVRLHYRSAATVADEEDLEEQSPGTEAGEPPDSSEG